MTVPSPPPTAVQLIAVPETAGSALYGMLDVLLAAGTLWQELADDSPGQRLFEVALVSHAITPFDCGNRIPVRPDYTPDTAPAAGILILPELWLGPHDNFHGRYPELIEWIRQQYRRGAFIFSACSGAIMLAETGLLDGCPATSHWGYERLFHKQYPRVRFQPEPNLVFADPAGRIVTAGGTTSWHDLALHLIARFGSPGEAMRIAQVYLLKWHGEGQLPYRPLVRAVPHADAVVKRCERWLAQHFRESGVVQRVVAEAGIPERTLKRRFRAATGASLLDYVQNLRIEGAKRMLETGDCSVEAIGVAVGYEDLSFFRRLFRRRTGMTPRAYRQLFAAAAGGETGRSPIDPALQ